MLLLPISDLNFYRKQPTHLAGNLTPLTQCTQENRHRPAVLPSFYVAAKSMVKLVNEKKFNCHFQ